MKGNSFPVFFNYARHGYFHQSSTGPLHLLLRLPYIKDFLIKSVHTLVLFYFKCSILHEGILIKNLCNY